MDTPGWVSAALEAIREGRARAAIVGCGYVGLTLAVEAARKGSPVTGIDVNEALVKELRAGSNPVPDVYIPDGEIAQLRDAGRLSFATSMDGPFDVYVICVHTPLREGSPDLRYVESAAESVSRVLQRGALVVLESTTYPGTTEELLRPILEEATGLVAGVDFSIAHSPERINPGDTTWGLHNTPKVVGGLEPWCTELACAFYERVAHSVVPVSSPRAAEITKLFENSHRLVNIALANEMAIVCHDFGIDPWEVLHAASSKPFGFTPFRPGPGVGGECLPDGQRVLLRRNGAVTVTTVEEAWRAAAAVGSPPRMADRVEVVIPRGIEAASLEGDTGAWHEVTAMARRPYDGEVVEVTTREGRRLEVTAGHPMLVWDGERLVEKAASDCAPGDLVPIWRGHRIWDAVWNPRVDMVTDVEWPSDTNVGVRLAQGDWRPWRDLIRARLGASAADEVIRHGRLPLRAFIELEREGLLHVSHDDLVLWTGRGRSARPFPAVVELTPDVARLIGYYLSEGCITEARAPRVYFAFHRDEVETKADLLKILGSLGLSASVREDPKWQVTSIKVSSRPLALLIGQALGCGVNSYDARIPSQLLGASSVHRIELLAGLLRGDGSVWTESRRRSYVKNGRRFVHRRHAAEVGYWSVNHGLVDDVEYLLLSLGYVPSIRYRRLQHGAELRLHGSQDLAWLAELFLDKKGARLRAYIHGRRRPVRKSRSFTRVGDLHLVPIKSVLRKRYRGYVYSVETGPSHTFAATHGIVVHNCIPVDPQYLAWRARGKLGRAFRMLETARDVNDRMPAHVAQRAAEILNESGKAVRGARVLLLGVAFKGSSAVTRESPAVRVADRLATSGAELTYHDPFVQDATFNGVVYESQELTDELLDEADIVIVLTDHPNVDYHRVVDRAKVIYDTRGVTESIPAPRANVHRA